MKNSEKIFQFSASHAGTFGRSDLLSWVESNYPSSSLESIDVTLRRMTNQGVLIRTGKGKYKESIGRKTKFSIRPNEEVSSLFHSIKVLYPYTKLCIWNANTLSSLMHHVPNLDIIIVETERIAMEPVFCDLSNISQRRVFVNLSEKEYFLYASGNSCIIVKPLISESPLIGVDGIEMPCLEKILVDVSIDPEFPYARDSELQTIYENAGAIFAIDKKCMLRYASRRGKREEISKLLDSTIV